MPFVATSQVERKWRAQGLPAECASVSEWFPEVCRESGVSFRKQRWWPSALAGRVLRVAGLTQEIEQLKARQVVFAVGLLGFALSAVSLSREGGLLLWAMVPTGYYFLI